MADAVGTAAIRASRSVAQFTSTAFTDALRAAGIAIGMDGRGRWMDNVLVERLWRSMKDEEIHMRDCATALEARRGIGNWIAYCSRERDHMAFGYRTPEAMSAAGLRTCGRPPCQ